MTQTIHVSKCLSLLSASNCLPPGHPTPNYGLYKPRHSLPFVGSTSRRRCSTMLSPACPQSLPRKYVSFSHGRQMTNCTTSSKPSSSSAPWPRNRSASNSYSTRRSWVDRTPTQSLCRMNQLLGDKALTLDKSFLRELFLQRLPAPVRMVLAVTPEATSLDELATLADS